MWGIARKFHTHVARHGEGAGLRLWAYLGRYDVAALALLRARCCGDVPAARAATPSTPCESLTGVLQDLGNEPTDDNVARYEEAIDCLKARQVHLPELWERVGKRQSRETFATLLKRVASRQAHPAPSAEQ